MPAVVIPPVVSGVNTMPDAFSTEILPFKFKRAQPNMIEIYVRANGAALLLDGISNNILCQKQAGTNQAYSISIYRGFGTVPENLSYGSDADPFMKDLNTGLTLTYQVFPTYYLELFTTGEDTKLYEAEYIMGLGRFTKFGLNNLTVPTQYSYLFPFTSVTGSAQTTPTPAAAAFGLKIILTTEYAVNKSGGF